MGVKWVKEVELTCSLSLHVGLEFGIELSSRFDLLRASFASSSSAAGALLGRLILSCKSVQESIRVPTACIATTTAAATFSFI